MIFFIDIIFFFFRKYNILIYIYIYIYIYFIFFPCFVPDSDSINIFRSDLKRYEYRNPFRRAQILINQNDNITLDERMLGGYHIPDPNSVHILNVQCIFNNVLVELTLSVPVKYKTDPVQLLNKKKEKYIIF